MFPINKLKYKSSDSKGVKYYFNINLFSYFSCQEVLSNKPWGKNPKGK